VTLVLAPEVRYDQVAALFAGWEGGPTDRHAWLAGEPIGARWSRGEDEVRYSANPALGLRVLTGCELGGRLPLLGRARARALAGSEDLADALLGITAAGLQEDLEAVEALEGLTRDPRPEVRAAAELALRRIGVAFLRLGADRLAQHHGVPLKFMGPPATRRQLVRLIAAHPPEDEQRREDILRAALADEDWEVRWSAVVAAWELGSEALAIDLRRCATADRAHTPDRQILEALRDVVGWHLVGGRSEHPGTTHLEACLNGEPAPHDRAFQLVTGLRRPLPLEPETPGPPPGFCLVPAVLHWVGDADLPLHPLRAVVPDAPFAIAEDSHGEATAQELPARLSALARELGRPLRLPTADELERALRGPDARRHPWGNGRERSTPATRSPWGLRRPLARPEWVDTPDGPLALVHTCAGPPQPVASAALRPVAL
jgi:hypothetical protein